MRVIQGTSHTLQYKNNKGRKTDVDLYYKDVTIPCNKYFWKVIHDVEKNEAIAFVGINDPHYEITGKREKDRLFKDVTNLCDQLAWVGWSVRLHFLSVVLSLRACVYHCKSILHSYK